MCECEEKRRRGGKRARANTIRRTDPVGIVTTSVVDVHHHVAPSFSICIFHMSFSSPRRASHTSSADDNGGSTISPSSHAHDTCDKNTDDED